MPFGLCKETVSVRWKKNMDILTGHVSQQSVAAEVTPTYI